MIKDLCFVAISSLVSLAVLFLLTKLMGQKQISQLNMFDYIIGISIGSIAAEMASEIENPEKPLLAMMIYGVVAFLISVITAKSPRARRMISGAPVILMRGDVIYRDKLKKARLDINDFLMSCREKGYFNLSDIELAVLEHNGSMSFLLKESRRPLMPEDMNISPEQQKLGYEVIMDGAIMKENLKKCGRDEAWLNAELKKQGFTKASEVFVGVFDCQSNLSLWRGEEK